MKKIRRNIEMRILNKLEEELDLPKEEMDLLEQYSRVQIAEKRKWIDAAIPSLTSLVSIILIMNHERAHIVATKAFSLLRR